MNSMKHLNYEELLKIFKYISLGYTQEKIIQLTRINRSTLYRLIIVNSKITTDETGLSLHIDLRKAIKKNIKKSSFESWENVVFLC